MRLVVEQQHAVLMNRFCVWQRRGSAVENNSV
jgi:hypothetical protein